MRFGSLFAGIGGIDLGLERAGMQCAWQCEINDYATKVLEKHWPDVTRFRDVREVGRHNLEPVELICGGFPCQDISYAGRGAGLDGERSGLFFEALRVVSELRPRYVLLENVAALLSRGLERVLGELAQIGYDAEWHCIPAASVGAPHIRDRVFVLAYPSGERCGEARGDREQSKERATVRRSILADTNGKRSQGRDVGGMLGTTEESIRELERANATRGWGQWDVEPSVGRVAARVPRRVDRLRCLGNAVVPQVAQYIGERIMASVLNPAT